MPDPLGKRVLGHGPRPCDIMLVGEAPGREEANRGVPFIGMAGEELNRHYLPLAGLSRGRIRVNNVWPFRPPKNRDPNPDEIDKGCALLLEDITNTDPSIIIAAGRISASVFAGRNVVMERDHGIPFWWEDRIVIPVYHPALGLHTTGMIRFIRDDFMAVGRVLAGELLPRVSGDASLRSPVEYAEVCSVPELLDTLAPLRPGGCIAIDTETDDGHPWSVQYSVEEGKAYLISASTLPILAALGRAIADNGLVVVMHSAKFDLGILALMGITVGEFADTMIAAYVLGDEAGLGLKVLGYRHFGIDMADYRELVAESSARRAVEYVEKAASMEWGDSDPVVEYKGREIKVRRPQNVGKRLMQLLKKHGSDGTLLREKWEGMKEVDAVVDALGDMPFGSIAEIDRERAVYYACQDADVTLRLWNKLRGKLVDTRLMPTFKRDCGIVPLVADMEREGMPVDREYFMALEHDLEGRRDDLLMRICDFMRTDVVRGRTFLRDGEAYNPNSPVLCAEYCEFLGLRAKNTEAENLKPYADKYEGIRLHLEYKHLSKILGTYVSKFAHLTTDRLSTDINLVRTGTGRLSSSNPNLQNIPVRDELGRKIRSGFKVSGII